MAKRKRTAASRSRRARSRLPDTRARRLQEELAKTKAAKVKADLEAHLREVENIARAARERLIAVEKAKSDEEIRLRLLEAKRLDCLILEKAKKAPTRWEKFLKQIGLGP